MEIRIDLSSRLYNDIENNCRNNNVTIEDYCLSAIVRQVSLDKYGDLNEKVKKSKPTQEDTMPDKETETVANIQASLEETEIEEILIEDSVVDETETVNKPKHRIIKTK